MTTSRIVQRTRSAFAAFLALEASGGIVLFVAVLAGMVWANVGGTYGSFWHTSLRVAGIERDLQHWINDGLMTIFFLVVGLEINREVVSGELRDRRVALLPGAAAVGGMVVPAVFYIAIAGGGAAGAGWGIPMATDIAFVVGTLALLGPRAPQGLKVFLLALAIVDDIGAIVIIAFFYSGGVDLLWLVAAACALAVVALLRSLRISHPLVYVLPGLVAWASMMSSGVHPTIAGVALGLIVPAEPIRDRSVVDDLQRWLHPVSSYVVVPVFGLANAGLALTAASVTSAVESRVFWAIVVGLVAGKTLGIALASWAMRRFRIARAPADVTSRDLVGGAALAGIGFTVSLFIAGLAFESGALADQARLGILAGSLVSAAVGATALVVGHRRPEITRREI